MVSDKLQKEAKKLFLRQYPKADMSKFIFGYNLNNNSSPKDSHLILINDNRFKMERGFISQVQGNYTNYYQC